MAKKTQTKASLVKVPTSLYFTRQPSDPSPSIIHHHPQILTINHFYSPNFSSQLLSQLKNLTLETTPLLKSRLYAARVNDRISIEDPQAAQNMWNTLRPIILQDPDLYDEFQTAKGLNPNIRIYRYGPGQYFGKHVDESVMTFVPKGVTKWTVLLYLTGTKEGLNGGETVFYDDKEKIIVTPVKGLICLHKHGDDCLEHEAMKVDFGEKWVVRSDVVF